MSSSSFDADNLPSSAHASGSSTLRRDPWLVLDALLQTLTEASNTTRSIQATVEALCEATSSNTAYWYSKTSGKILVEVGQPLVPHEWFNKLIASELPKLKSVNEFQLWRNPNKTATVKTALFLWSAKTNGLVVALRGANEPDYDDRDIKVAQVTLKLLLAQRANNLTSTKKLLVSLLQCLTTIIDAKDPFTAGHSERVARIATLLVKKMELGETAQADVFLAGLLHDVGKIGLRDDVLQRPGKLSREEMDEVRQHPLISDRIVASIKPFERLRQAVRHHHERYDGTGYPDRLAKDDIPILARILAVADACDAMMSPRRYRPAHSPIDIDAVFASESGRQFDPLVVRAFMAIRHDIYPPIYQKGFAESALHAIDSIVDNMTEATAVKLPPFSKPQ